MNERDIKENLKSNYPAGMLPVEDTFNVLGINHETFNRKLRKGQIPFSVIQYAEGAKAPKFVKVAEWARFLSRSEIRCGSRPTSFL